MVPTGRRPAGVRAGRAPAGAGDGGRALAGDDCGHAALPPSAGSDRRALDAVATVGRGSEGVGLVGLEVRGKEERGFMISLG